ncbi:MAG: histidine kinase [Proteobacteria bacterium]|nr:histidine kinase [Pseudomonadota bacterium]
MAVIVIIGGASMLYYPHQMDTMLVSMVEKEFNLYKIAEDMELALANQKGLLTYYLVDGDVTWLKSLGEYRQVFYQMLEQAKGLELTPKQRQSLEVISEKYNAYVLTKDIAIDNYKTKKLQGAISSLHEKQRDVFFGVLELCRAFSQDQWQVIVNKQKASEVLSRHLKMVVFIATAMFTLLCAALLFILHRNILGPIRELAIETGSTPEDSSRDEVDSLTHSFKSMMKDLGETSDELARSRKNLLQAERMVMVGELAAGVAHTIRNPFTSIKMRMFSLGRSLQLTDAQGEDLQVISDEIARIDRIVENFLEFARSPKLRLRECSLGDVVKSVITLLEYRLRAYNVELHYVTQPDLPKVRVDADRIKEALVNLVMNACEAMETGGKISITETHERHPKMGDVVAVTVSDNGPGIPEAIRDKVVTPFFTTKEDGSGLGLSIVNRIVREHNGKFLVAPNLDGGAQCTILLPTGEGDHESDSDH